MDEANGAGLTMNNATSTPAMIEKIMEMNDSARTLLHDAAEKLSLSARAYHRILKVARTLADLEESRDVSRMNIAEAISYRTISSVSALAA